MSDDSKIEDINENENSVDELVEAYTRVPSSDVEVEDNENDALATEVEELSEKIFSENPGGKPNFFTSCAAIVSDSVIIAVSAFVLMYVVDFILRQFAGLYIVEKNQMFFILYVIVTLLYVSILESKLGFTVGKTVFGIKVAKN